MVATLLFTPALAILPEILLELLNGEAMESQSQNLAPISSPAPR